MKDRVQTAIGLIESNGWLENLEECRTPEARIRQLHSLMPEMKSWFWEHKRQLFFTLHICHNVDMGVCEYLDIDDHYQRCCWPETRDELRKIEIRKLNECNCLIPQHECKIRNDENEIGF